MAEELKRRYEGIQQEYDNAPKKYLENKAIVVEEMINFLIKNLSKIPEGLEGIYFEDPGNVSFTYRLRRNGILTIETNGQIIDDYDFKKPGVKEGFSKGRPLIVKKLLEAYSRIIEEKGKY